MIQPNELRIGNLIWDNERNKERLVTHRIISDIVSNVGNNNHENDFSPILLTEEWLLKFGFEVVLWNGVIRQYFIHITENKRCALSFHFGEFIGFPDRLDKVTIGSPPHESGTTFGRFQIQYVHQLQNLYFALTGKELELKKEGTIWLKKE